jgi:hypothetical protein
LAVVVRTSSRNLTKPSDRHDWIVCGWFTDDPVYRGYAQDLAASLDQVGAPYDLVATEKLSGGWEANTRAKPAQILAAMDRHPDKTVIFMDVDYTAVGDLAPLAQMRGDIAVKMGTKRRANGSTRITMGDQVMVIKPNVAARHFVETWLRAIDEARPGDSGETFFSLAVGRARNCALANMGSAYVATLLTHHRASKHTTRMNGFGREMMHLFFWAIGRTAPKSGGPG